MLDLDKWQEIMLTLRRNPLRTLMTAWGVFWGSFMLVLMLGFGNGLELGVRTNMLGFTPNNVYMWGQRTSRGFKGMPEGRRVRLTTADIAPLALSTPDLVALAPRIQLGGWQDGNNVTRGEAIGNFGVMGEYPAFAVVEQLMPARGRFINDLDLKLRRKVAVIGSNVQRVLFTDGTDPMGQYIKIRGVFFQVVGITESERPGEAGERDNNTVQIPFTTFQSAFNTGNQVGWFGARVRDGADPRVVEKALRRSLAASHDFDPEDRQAVGSFNMSEQNVRVTKLFGGVRFFVWFVSVATLLAGALGVSNIMLVSVKERTREFGVRKALGATPASILSQVLQEASVLTGLAGYFGVVCGVGTLELARRLLADGQGPLGAPNVDVGVALAASVVLALAGVIAGIAPARLAARIQPVAALRAE